MKGGRQCYQGQAVVGKERRGEQIVGAVFSIDRVFDFYAAKLIVVLCELLYEQ